MERTNSTRLENVICEICCLAIASSTPQPGTSARLCNSCKSKGTPVTQTGSKPFSTVLSAHKADTVEIDRKMLETQFRINVLTAEKDRETDKELKLQVELAHLQYAFVVSRSQATGAEIAKKELRLREVNQTVCSLQRQLTASFEEMIDLRKEREALIAPKRIQKFDLVFESNTRNRKGQALRK